MKTAIIFDCEFLTTQDAPRRFWCGPKDPDPVVAQIGAVKMDLENDFSLLETMSVYVKPKDRYGNAYKFDPFFTELTSISNEIVEKNGLELEKALHNLDVFSNDAKFWSWGKDEFNMLAISCYVSNISPPIAATRFGNACKLLLQAGMPYEDIIKTRSSDLAGYYGLDHSALTEHNALDDALSVAYVLRHLLERGLLSAENFHAQA